MHSRKTLRHHSTLALLVCILLLSAIAAASPKKLLQHEKTFAVVGHGEQDAHPAVARGAETLTFTAALASAKRRGSVLPIAHRGRVVGVPATYGLKIAPQELQQHCAQEHAT